jgi:4-hydroxybenzoate polyprenyltransferase
VEHRSRALSASWIVDGGGPQCGIERPQSDLRPEIDRINKPKRALPSGRLSLGDAWAFTRASYVVALVLAWFVEPGGRHECFWIVAVATIITVLYSAPPFRTKRLGIWANVTIAIPRGVLLKVAGWSAVKTIAGLEPWFIGAIFGLFAAPDDEGFRGYDGGSARRRTLPIIYGVERAAG